MLTRLPAVVELTLAARFDMEKADADAGVVEACPVPLDEVVDVVDGVEAGDDAGGVDGGGAAGGGAVGADEADRIVMESVVLLDCDALSVIPTVNV